MYDESWANSWNWEDSWHWITLIKLAWQSTDGRIGGYLGGEERHTHSI